MATELDSLVVRFLGDGTSYLNMLRTSVAETRAAAAQVQGIASKIEGFGAALAGFAAPVAGALLGATGIVGAFASVVKGVNLAAEAEKNEIAFGTMLKSMEKGKQLVGDLQDFAAATPLNTGDIQNAAKTLLQFGVAGDDLIDTMRRLGDVTGGQAAEFQRIALVFGQVASQGRLMGNDVFQFINAGWNPLNEIVKLTGKSMSQVKADMEKGKIGVELVRKALESATSDGGQFFNLMQKQSKSIGGLFSTMQDDISAALRQLGTDVVEVFRLKDAMQLVSSAAQSVTGFLKMISPTVREFVGPVWEFVGAQGKAAWDRVSTAVSDFIAFAQPVIRAYKSFVAAEWEAIKSGAVSLWTATVGIFKSLGSYISGVWAALTNDATIKWDKIRDKIQAAIILGEFVIRNFGDVAKMVWTGAEYTFVKFANQIEHFFTSSLPAIISWMKDDWQVKLGDLFNWTVKAVEKLGPTIAKIMMDPFSLLTEDIAGEFQKGLEQLKNEFQRGSDPLKLPPRQVGGIEQQLKEQFEAQGKALGGSFEEFRKKKMEQFAKEGLIPPAQINAAARLGYGAGQKIGDAMAKGVKQGQSKIEAALFGSQEALARIQAFQDAIEGKKDTGKGITGVAANSQEGKDLAVQKEQRDLLKKIAAKKSLTVAAAGLA